MEFFQTLGTLVGKSWRDRDYNEEVFAEVASAALAQLPPARHVSLWDVVRWGLMSDQLPRQDDIDAKFGDPPLTVYTGRKFRIEVLFWTQGLPSIHQHGFSGAFHVLHGSSIHSVWDFEPSHQIEARLLLGRVLFKSSEILLKGDSRPIHAGNLMFHATYHLDRPSISVVVRTLSEPNKLPQYMLLPPTLAVAPLDQIATVRRQTQLLRMLIAAGKRTELYEIARHLIATKDAYSIFEFLNTIFGSIDDQEERLFLLSTTRSRYGRLADALTPVLQWQEEGNRILKLHESVDSVELRFFLALLRNVPARPAILKLIQQRFAGRDAVGAIVSWVRELSDLKVMATQFGEPALLMLRCLLEDWPRERIVKAFREEYRSSIAELSELCSALQASWLLRPLSLGNPIAQSAGELAGATVGSENPGAGLEQGKLNGRYRCLLDVQPDPLVPASLSRPRVRATSQMLSVNPMIRFSARGHCPDESIPFADGVSTDEPTVWMTDPVTSIVSPFVVGATLQPIISALQSGGGIPGDASPDLIERLAAARLVYDAQMCEEERRAWSNSLLSARDKFRDGYVALGSLLHPFTLSATRSHFRYFIQQGCARYGDKQTPRRWVAHNEPVSRFVLYQLAHIVEAIAGVPIKPSYVYFSSYYDGARLGRHTDREQCEFSVSMLLDYSPEPDAETPWPLWLETRNGPVAIHQRLGDALVYRGRELPHYREQLPSGHTSTHLFLHYVPRDFTGSLD